MPRILLADDHAVVRKGLRQILADEFPGAEFGEAGSGQAVLDLCRLENWDLVLLDVSMPGLNGLEALKEIRRMRRATPVLILSLHPESEYGVRALRSGASGYVTKQDPPELLVAAVRRAIAGGKYITPSLAEELAFEVGPGGDRDPHEILSDREFQVLRLIGSGRTTTEIAQQLSLSPKTVATYRARILEKMNLKTTSQLVRYAIEHGMT